MPQGERHREGHDFQSPGAPSLSRRSRARQGGDFDLGSLTLLIYTQNIYRSVPLPKPDIAKLFQNGRSQAVRLPKEFRFEGDRVRIRRVAQGVLLEPLIPNTAKWFEELDQFNSEPFPARTRRQPVTPKRKIF